MSTSLQKTRAARKRAVKHAKFYRNIAATTRDARRIKRMTQKEFAVYLGVSEITVRRWETALGHKPNPTMWEILKEIANGNTVDRRKTV